MIAQQPQRDEHMAKYPDQWYIGGQPKPDTDAERLFCSTEQFFEYIVSEAQLKRFKNGGYFDVLLKEIRSRPHTPTPEPSVDCFWKCEHGKRLQDEAARTATLAENKRVLDEIRNTIKYEGVTGLIRKIESLRQAGEQE